LIENGWSQISITSEEVFGESSALSGTTTLVPNILANETNLLFSWQFNRENPCPKGCGRAKDGEGCEVKAIGHEEL
jgi:hypothetical protein